MSTAKQILQSLLDDDVIQVRPSDRERFMDDWREAMGKLQDMEALLRASERRVGILTEAFEAEATAHAQLRNARDGMQSRLRNARREIYD